MQGNGHPFKLLITYDPLPEHREEYFKYVLGEFVPAMEQLGLAFCEAWHTAYGEYPLRLAGFLAEDRETLLEILTSEAFLDLEAKFQEYVLNYNRKIVPQNRRFQF